MNSINFKCRHVVVFIFILLLQACVHAPDKNPYGYNHYKVGKQATRIALDQLGVPYVYGGASPRGFDCSGLVQFTYQQLGFSLPRTVSRLYNYAKPIKRKQLRAGDLIFFNTDGNRISHVGIYFKPHLFIHAPKTGRSVSIENLNNPYWRRRFVSAGRPN